MDARLHKLKSRNGAVFGLHDSSRSLQAGIPSNCQRSSEISAACAATVALSKAFAASSAAIRWCSAAQDAESVCELMPAPVTCTICFQRWTHRSRAEAGLLKVSRTNALMPALMIRCCFSTDRRPHPGPPALPVLLRRGRTGEESNSKTAIKARIMLDSDYICP